MSSEEQTVLEALAAGSHCDCVGGYVERGLVSPSCWLHNDAEDALDLIGIEPDMPLSRLQDALAIAARVRACAIPFPQFGFVRTPIGEIDLPEALLAFLRGDAT